MYKVNAYGGGPLSLPLFSELGQRSRIADALALDTLDIDGDAALARTRRIDRVDAQIAAADDLEEAHVVGARHRAQQPPDALAIVHRRGVGRQGDRIDGPDIHIPWLAAMRPAGLHQREDVLADRYGLIGVVVVNVDVG